MYARPWLCVQCVQDPGAEPGGISSLVLAAPPPQPGVGSWLWPGEGVGVVLSAAQLRVQPGPALTSTPLVLSRLSSL